MKRMIRYFAVVVVPLVVVGHPASSNAVDFAAPQSYPVGTSPRAIVVGDFNGDGKPDTAVANSGSGNVSILLGNGDGTLQAAVNFDAGIANPSILAAGDFNNDGKLDLTVFQVGDPANSIAGAVSILLGNGNGTFQAPKTLTLTARSSQLAVADFNADKNSDLAVSEFDPAAQTGTVDIFIGKGDGTFQSAKQPSVSNLQNGSFIAADFNGDSKTDLAAPTTTGILILLGKGDGTFQAPSTVNVTLPAAGVQVADFNHDGKLDLVVDSTRTVSSCRLFCVTGTNQHISLFLANGDGTFQGEQIVASASSTTLFGGTRGSKIFGPAAVGDYNGDGNLDLGYLSKSLPSSFYDFLLLGKGDGTFSPTVLVPAILGFHVVADLNSDKNSDLVVIVSGSDIGVFLNTSPTTGADLGIIAAGAAPNPVGVGNNVTYTADVLNEGPKDATGVIFSDTLPNGVSFVSATATQGSCIQSHGLVTCNVDSLASAFDFTVTIVATPTAPGTITNTMNVTATEQDLVSANNSSTQTTTVVPVYTLTITKAGNGSGRVDIFPNNISCGNVCSVAYMSGTVVGLGELPDSNSLFGGWGGACSGNSSCQVTMDADKTVSAHFVLGMSLSVTMAGTAAGSVASNPDGIICTNNGGISGPCSALYFSGTAVSLTATAIGGSTFGGWSGACTGPDPNVCKVMMNSSQSVTATFNPPPDFTVSPAAANLSVKRGGQVSDVLTFPVQGGFSGTIALTCSVSGPTPMPTCSISPNSVTPGNSATLTVNASGLAAALTPRPFERAGTLYAAWLPVGLLGCVLATRFDKKRRGLWLLSLLLMMATFLPAACGTVGSDGPQSQVYTVTVTGTSGTLQRSTQMSVTVN